MKSLDFVLEKKWHTVGVFKQGVTLTIGLIF